MGKHQELAALHSDLSLMPVFILRGVGILFFLFLHFSARTSNLEEVHAIFSKFLNCIFTHLD